MLYTNEHEAYADAFAESNAVIDDAMKAEEDRWLPNATRVIVERRDDRAAPGRWVISRDIDFVSGPRAIPPG